MSRVLIADDHPAVRMGYKQFLEAEPSINEIGEASSGNETIEALRHQKWDLLMMDIHMPDRSGLDVLVDVKSGYPTLRVLIISGLPENQYARNVLRAGASGFLSKGGTPQEMLKAVRLILKGRRYVSASFAESIAVDSQKPKNQARPLHATLSTREFQLFCKLAGGAAASLIGREMSLSRKTVATYRTRILEKMGFTSNAELTAYAMRNSLIR
jgi:two-component system, NarL family, invasion response regulator UvrY